MARPAAKKGSCGGGNIYCNNHGVLNIRRGASKEFYQATWLSLPRNSIRPPGCPKLSFKLMDGFGEPGGEGDDAVGSKTRQE